MKKRRIAVSPHPIDDVAFPDFDPDAPVAKGQRYRWTGGNGDIFQHGEIITVSRAYPAAGKAMFAGKYGSWWMAEDEFERVS